jgi:hypothetical protein
MFDIRARKNVRQRSSRQPRLRTTATTMHLCVDSPPWENTPPLVMTRARTHTSFPASLSHPFCTAGLVFHLLPTHTIVALLRGCHTASCCAVVFFVLSRCLSIHQFTALHTIDPRAHAHRWCMWVPAMQPHVRISLWIYTGARWVRCMATVVHSELTDTHTPLPFHPSCLPRCHRHRRHRAHVQLTMVKVAAEADDDSDDDMPLGKLPVKLPRYIGITFAPAPPPVGMLTLALPTQSLARSPAHLFTHHLLTCSLACLFTHSRIHSLTYTHTHTFAQSPRSSPKKEPVSPKKEPSRPAKRPANDDDSSDDEPLSAMKSSASPKAKKSKKDKKEKKVTRSHTHPHPPTHTHTVSHTHTHNTHTHTHTHTSTRSHPHVHTGHFALLFPVAGQKGEESKEGEKRAVIAAFNTEEIKEKRR